MAENTEYKRLIEKIVERSPFLGLLHKHNYNILKEDDTLNLLKAYGIVDAGDLEFLERYLGSFTISITVLFRKLFFFGIKMYQDYFVVKDLPEHLDDIESMIISGEELKTRIDGETYEKIKERYEPFWSREKRTLKQVIDLINVPYFWPNISRNEVMMLKNKPNGTYIIRFSSKDDMYVLSYCDTSKVSEVRIYVKNYTFRIDNGKTYSSLQELIDDRTLSGGYLVDLNFYMVRLTGPYIEPPKDRDGRIYIPTEFDQSKLLSSKGTIESTILIDSVETECLVLYEEISAAEYGEIAPSIEKYREKVKYDVYRNLVKIYHFNLINVTSGGEIKYYKLLYHEYLEKTLDDVRNIDGGVIFEYVDGKIIIKNIYGKAVIKYMLEISNTLKLLHGHGIYPFGLDLKYFYIKNDSIRIALFPFCHESNTYEKPSNRTSQANFPLAPETIKHHRYNSSSIVFTLGMMLWKLFYGDNSPYSSDPILKELYNRIPINANFSDELSDPIKFERKNAALLAFLKISQRKDGHDFPVDVKIIFILLNAEKSRPTMDKVYRTIYELFYNLGPSPLCDVKI